MNAKFYLFVCRGVAQNVVEVLLLMRLGHQQRLLAPVGPEHDMAKTELDIALVGVEQLNKMACVRALEGGVGVAQLEVQGLGRERGMDLVDAVELGVHVIGDDAPIPALEKCQLAGSAVDAVAPDHLSDLRWYRQDDALVRLIACIKHLVYSHAVYCAHLDVERDCVSSWKCLGVGLEGVVQCCLLLGAATNVECG